MKLNASVLRIGILFGCLYSGSLLFAVGNNGASPSMEDEMAIVKQIHDAACADDFASIGTFIASASGLKRDEASSVALARRAATVCGQLQNENQYARAAKLAAYTVRLLTGQKEPDTASRVERLYWEGLLQGRYLDQKAKAVKLLDEAAHLAPKDDRIASLEQEFADALAQFGR